uniref:Cupredoxin n=1 Tax=Psilocybe cubensis TaxID=181762 RepID=A0A8H7Y4V3_PSICU
MHFSTVATALLFATYVAAEDHIVTVGANNQLLFSPTNITIADGDTISFQLSSVTQSSFTSPCVQSPNAINSGFMPINATVMASQQFPQWQISVSNASSPIWFFCAQTMPVSHCEQGMVFAVNAPPAKSFAQFQANAMNGGSTNANSTSTNGTATNSTSGGDASTPGSGSASGGSASTPGSGSASTGNASAAPPPNSSQSAKTGGALKVGGPAAGIITLTALFATFIL